MAKKKTTTKKAPTKKVEAEAVVPKVEQAPSSIDEQLIQLLMKEKFSGDRGLSEKRLRYIKAMTPSPETEEELTMLVKRYIKGLPLQINDNKSETRFGGPL